MAAVRDSTAHTDTNESPAPLVATSSDAGASGSLGKQEGGTLASARGGAVGRPIGSTRASATSRLRPRNIRRDEAERESIARMEEQKEHARTAEERRARGRLSRFRSKRSRGDTMGARGDRTIMTASGPFSSGVAGQGITAAEPSMVLQD